MKKYLILFSLLVSYFFNGIAAADPKPLGLELGKATTEDFRASFPDSYENGINAYSNGEMYGLRMNSINIEGIAKDASFIFDQDKKLACVIMVFNKNKFDELNAQLKQKYKKVIYSKIPFVGDKKVKYKDGKSVIEISAPHLSFEMEIIYSTQAFLDLYNNSLKQKENNRKKNEGELL